MDLYSGLPYWIVKDPLDNYFNPLKSDHKVDVLIVGSGITGALVAHELCNAGIKCSIIDKRSLSTGSSVASTALLQYEIDTPLFELVKMMDEGKAVRAYQSCLQAITDIEKVFKDINYNPDLEKVPSVFYASNRRGVRTIRKEYSIRRKYDLPVDYYDKNEVEINVGINSPAALKNDTSAQMDAYAGATHLIHYHREKNELNVFTHTEIEQFQEKKTGYELLTTGGHTIKAKYVVVAAGFESGFFLPRQVMELTSTYVILSEPIEDQYFWPEKSMLWETAQPYMYIRTTGNRIMVGGEDEDISEPARRDKLMKTRIRNLERKFHKLFPDIPFKTEMSWGSTFSKTKDGLPYIGNWPGNNKMFFALGYGGNGITYSMIAAQVIKNKLQGIRDDREDVFGFERSEES